MTVRTVNPSSLFRAFGPLFRVPGTTQVVDFPASVPGVTGVTGFLRTRMGVRAGAHLCACLRAITRARPPRHTHHTRHKMSKNKDLGCSGYPEQLTEARNSSVPGPSDRENLAAFARRLGVNRSTVTRAAQSGRLVLDADGRVCVLASLTRWHATRGGRDDVAARHAAARGFGISADVAGVATPATADETSPRSGDQGEGDGEAPAPGSRAFWEAEKVRWQNAELLLAMDLESGVRIPRASMEREAKSLGATLRATAERLIDQTAPRLAAAGSDSDRRRLLVSELAAARRMLQREFGAAARRLRPDGAAVRLGASNDSTEA